MSWLSEADPLSLIVSILLLLLRLWRLNLKIRLLLLLCRFLLRPSPGHGFSTLAVFLTLTPQLLYFGIHSGVIKRHLKTHLQSRHYGLLFEFFRPLRIPRQSGY